MKNCEWNDGMKYVEEIRFQFLRMFTQMFANYDGFIDREKIAKGELNKCFMKDKFIEASHKRHKSFFKQFVETAMFSKFLDKKIMPQKNEDSYQMNIH